MTAENQTPPKKNFSHLFYNRVTYLGVALCIVIFFAECLLFGIDFFYGSKNVYLGIITYVFLPIFLLIGLILIPIGALHKKKRIARGLATLAPKALYIDPTVPAHRNAIMVFLVGTTIVVIMTAIGSYKAFYYTESDHFCGVLCHQVMNPEFATYQNSSHAHVRCVDCHVGPGPDWYVKSKLSGVRQVYRAFTKTYAKPIPTPVHNLRPAAETCEHCHWPGKFYSSVELRRTYFPASDSVQPKWLMRMLVHVGRNQSQDYGIHAHMYIDNEIYYVADDDKRQVISWVKSKDKSGKEVIYTSPNSPYKNQPPPPEKVRKMDCIDCHNRPAHDYHSPMVLVNEVLTQGKVKSDIPLIKQNMMDALSKNYAITAEAVTAIPQALNAFYQKEHGDFYSQRPGDIREAVEETVTLFKNNFFPEMKARWDSHADNIGHLISPGCFRCHDGEHQNTEGKAISKDCTICHTIIEQGPSSAVEKSVDGLQFRHPFDEDETWKDMNCFDCHSGN